MIIEQLYCSVYIDAPLSLDELARNLAARISAAIESGPFSATLRLPTAEMELRSNDDATTEGAFEFPDGFVFFRYKLDVFVDPDGVGKDHVSQVAETLRMCWDSGWPAVAACDFEEQLPERGGFKSPNVPWPQNESDRLAISAKVSSELTSDG